MNGYRKYLPAPPAVAIVILAANRNTMLDDDHIEGTRFGSVGGGVSRKTALAVGLKVDVYALSGSLVSTLKQGRVNLDDSGVTLELLRHNAVDDSC